MKNIIMISAVFLFLVGCSPNFGKYKVQTPMGEEYMLLDEALTHIESYDALTNLYHQWGEMTSNNQGGGTEELGKLNRKRGEILQLQHWEQQRQKNAEEKQFQKKQSAKFEAWKLDRAKFIENTPGSLKNMKAPEVKKLVDNWGEGARDYRGSSEFFSVETFYKVFGRPESTQFISALNCYYFWYNCKDGKVQIQVDANMFDNNKVYIDGLNIF